MPKDHTLLCTVQILEKSGELIKNVPRSSVVTMEADAQLQSEDKDNTDYIQPRIVEMIAIDILKEAFSGLSLTCNYIKTKMNVPAIITGNRPTFEEVIPNEAPIVCNIFQPSLVSEPYLLFSGRVSSDNMCSISYTQYR